MCNGVSNATTLNPQYGSAPAAAGGPDGTSLDGGGAPMKDAPMKGGAPMKAVGQLPSQYDPSQGGGPTGGAALVSNPQLQTALQSLMQALTAITQLLSAQAGGGSTAAATGGGAVAAPAATTPPVAPTSTVPAGSVTLADGTPVTNAA